MPSLFLVSNRLPLPLERQRARRIGEAFRNAQRRLLLLDYDGTLVPFARTPAEAPPPRELLALLGSLAALPCTEVVLVSGRRRADIEGWFSQLPIGLIAEHGTWVKRHGEPWTMLARAGNDWKAHVRPLLERFVDATPGSFVEEKELSLAWHYRNVDTSLQSARVPELLGMLPALLQNFPLKAHEGKSVIEIKHTSIDKGKAAQRWLGGHPDFLLAAGDDWTDEDLFCALPQGAFSLKVGRGPTRASLRVRSHRGILQLLRRLAHLPLETTAESDR